MYESRKYPIVTNTIPDFTAIIGEDKQIVIELKGQANSATQRQLIATAQTFNRSFCKVLVSAQLPDRVLAKFQEAVFFAESQGIRVHHEVIPETVYVVSPIGLSTSSSKHTLAGQALARWCYQNNIACAPMTTDFSVLDSVLDSYISGLTLE